MVASFTLASRIQPGSPVFSNTYVMMLMVIRTQIGSRGNDWGNRKQGWSRRSLIQWTA